MFLTFFEEICAATELLVRRCADELKPKHTPYPTISDPPAIPETPERFRDVYTLFDVRVSSTEVTLLLDSH